MRLQSRSKFSSLILPVVILFATVVLGLFLVLNTEKKADALSAINDFKAGNIINDAVFYNKDTMDARQIQDFLNKLLPNCDTWGTQASGHGSLNNAQYAQQIQGWHGPPYVCLNNYYENPTTGETSYERGGGAFTGGISAAQIIYNASQDYGINPQVLLVLLKKESAGPLTADTWPLKNQYRFAMGYGCPDTGPGNSANCTTQRAGFYKQMTTAAWQLKYYKDNSNSYRYKLGWNDIQYSPTVSCGSKRVFIENVATLSLYIYTPYVPNDAALTNYPGTANCGAYGNRNFFMFFNEWFGSTQGIEIKGSIKAKYDAVNGVNLLGAPLEAEQAGEDGIYWQRFTNGHIVGSSKTGYFLSKGSIRAKWADLGYQNGQLKLPLSDEIYDLDNNLWAQRYQGGEIKTYGSGSHKIAIKGSIFAAYNDLRGKYSVPVEDETGDGNGVWWQRFTNGYIIGSAATGYYESTGSIRTKWASTGYQSSPVGIPAGVIEQVSSSCYSQKYTKGIIKGCSGKYDMVLDAVVN